MTCDNLNNRDYRQGRVPGKLSLGWLHRSEHHHHIINCGLAPPVQGWPVWSGLSQDGDLKVIRASVRCHDAAEWLVIAHIQTWSLGWGKFTWQNYFLFQFSVKNQLNSVILFPEMTDERLKWLMSDWWATDERLMSDWLMTIYWWLGGYGHRRTYTCTDNACS